MVFILSLRAKIPVVDTMRARYHLFFEEYAPDANTALDSAFKFRRLRRVHIEPSIAVVPEMHIAVIPDN